MRTAAALKLGFLILWAATSCSSDSPPEPGPAAARDDSPPKATCVDLLSVFESTSIPPHTQAAVAPELPRVQARNLLLQEDFAAEVLQRWVGGTACQLKVEELSPWMQPRQVQDPQVERPVLSITPQMGGLLRLVPAASHRFLQVSLRMRQVGPSADSGAGLSYRTLDQAVEAVDSSQQAELLRQLQLVGSSPRKAGTLTEGFLAASPQWQEHTFLLDREQDRKSLLLRLDVQEGVLLVEHLEIRNLTVPERFLRLANADPQALRRRLSMPLLNLDCLVLAGDSAIEAEIELPEGELRFDCETLIFGPRDRSLELTVKINDQIQAQTQALPSRSEIQTEPWVFPLDKALSGKIRLRLETHGRPDQVACWVAPRILARNAGKRPANVVLISLDTLRSDHLGCYGHPGGLSPAIDRVAAQGTVFRRMVAPASYTLPTHATLMTGQNPLAHGVHERKHRLQPSRSQPLATFFADRGYVTAAFTGGGFVSHQFGFDQGFSRYSNRDPADLTFELARAQRGREDNGRRRRGGMQEVVDWLRRFDDQPFFLFLHTYLVHSYAPSEEYLPRASTPLQADYEELRLIEQWGLAREGDADALRRLQSLYEATLAQADAQVVETVLQEISSLEDQTYVVIVSDHGEEFLEHGRLGHKTGLWGELLSVPWILRGPGVPAQEIHDAVEMADIAPTLLAQFQIQQPWATGRNVLEASARRKQPPDFLLVMKGGSSSWDGIVSDSWKLVRHHYKEEERISLFDFHADQADALDVAAEQPEVQERLVQRLEEHLQRAEGQTEQAELSPSVRQHLLDLGYTEDGP